MSPMVRIPVGIILGLIGIVGLFLPVLQGWMFLIPAFLLLFPNSRAAETMLDKIDDRLPKVAARLRKMGVGQEQTKRREAEKQEQ